MPTIAPLAPPVGLVPGFSRIQLMLPAYRAEPFDDPHWVFEPMYDGCRALLFGSDQGCRIEVFQDMPRQLAELRDRVADVLSGREAILDGQVVALDRQGKPALQHLLRGEGYPAFAAADLLWLDGADLRDLPLQARKKRLGELLPEDTGPLYKVLTIEEHGRALFGAIKRLDLGGIVAKCRYDPYRPATVWYQIPNRGHSSPSGAEPFRQRARLRTPSHAR
jgi:ATP-dependent DNA ligase